LGIRVIGPEAESQLDWLELTEALEAGHRMPKAEIGDTFLYRDPDTLLSRAAWIDGGEARWLYLAAHHLAVDAVSWQLLLEEIDATYRSLARDQAPVCNEESVSVGQWGAIVKAAAESGRFDDAIDYWRNASAGGDSELAALELYRGGSAQNGREGSAVRLASGLDPDWTARLHRGAASFGGVEVVLLAALAATFAEVLGVQGLPIALETHGRRGLPEVDLATTVGWLTAAFPFTLPVLGGEPEQDLRLTEAARTAVPDGGISFGALRMAGRPGTDDFADLPPVILNYLGRLESGGALSIGELCDADSCLLEARPADATRPYRLEIGAESRAEGLSVSWSYTPDSVSSELIEQLAAAYPRHLERYVAALPAEPTAETDPLADLDDLIAELE
jgi:non-ribosomal peptide synthase protein (TIGR01720 family)